MEARNAVDLSGLGPLHTPISRWFHGQQGPIETSKWPVQCATPKTTDKDLRYLPKRTARICTTSQARRLWLKAAASLNCLETAWRLRRCRATQKKLWAAGMAHLERKPSAPAPRGDCCGGVAFNAMPESARACQRRCVGHLHRHTQTRDRWVPCGLWRLVINGPVRL